MYSQFMMHGQKNIKLTRTTTNLVTKTNILLNLFRKARKFALQPDDGLHITETRCCTFINK